MNDWMTKMNQKFAAGTNGVIFRGNIFDMMFSDKDIPGQFHVFLAKQLDAVGYVVVQVSRYFGCRVVATGDPRCDKEVSSWFHKVSGIRQDTALLSCQPAGSSNDLAAVLRGLTALLRQDERKTAVIIEYPHHLSPASNGTGHLASDEERLCLETFHRWGFDEAIRKPGNRIVLLDAAEEIHEMLLDTSGGYVLIRVGYPDQQTLQHYLTILEVLRRKGRREFAALQADLPVQEAARLASGMRLVDVERLSRGAAAAGQPLGRDAILQSKADSVDQIAGHVLEIFKAVPDDEAEIRVNAHAMEFLARVKERICQGDKGLPSSILLTGVPGTGKSYLAQRFAQRLGWNGAAMKTLHSQWVGASERNLDKALEEVRALQPVVLFEDENDRSSSGSDDGGDSGTSARMQRRVMLFLGDEKRRGSILYLAATNRPHRLDPAIADRLQVKIPFIHPSPEECAALLPNVARQLGRTIDPDCDLGSSLSWESFPMMTIRGLLEIIDIAAHLMEGPPSRPLSAAAVRAAIRIYSPTFDAREQELIALTSISMTSAVFLYPWMTLEGLECKRREGYSLARYLADLVDDVTGALDHDKLQHRIRQLRTELHLDGRNA